MTVSQRPTLGMRRSRSPGTAAWPDRGALSLEFALIFPVIMLLVALIFNMGLWFYARNIALASAREGVRAARLQHAQACAADCAATAHARRTGDGILLGPHATTSSDATTIAVRVTGRAPSLLPGLRLEVSQTARGPRERFTTRANP